MTHTLKTGRPTARFDMSGGIEFTFKIHKDNINKAKKVAVLVEAMKDILTIEIKNYREKRSLDANAYMWVLCEKLAENQGITNAEVYQRAVREVGVCEVFPIKEEAAERWIEVWSGRGIGWFAEVLCDCKQEGYKYVRSYFGSSTYDAREMSRLVDHIVQDCEAVGIETLTPDELERLKANWKE